MANDMLDITESSHELKISEGVRRVMTMMSGWALVSAICGFLLAAAGIVVSVLGFIEVMNRSYFHEDEFFGVLALFGGAVIVFLVAKFMLDYRLNLKRSLRQESDVLLEKAFKGLRNALISFSILWVIGTALMLFVVAVTVYLWIVWG